MCGWSPKRKWENRWEKICEDFLIWIKPPLENPENLANAPKDKYQKNTTNKKNLKQPTMTENSEISKKKLRLKSSQSKTKKITQKGTRIRIITDLNK